MRIIKVYADNYNFSAKYSKIGEFIHSNFGINANDKLLIELINIVADYIIDIDLSDYPIEYQDIIQDWLIYKKSKKSSYKNKKSVDLFVYKLIKISHNNPAQARLIVEDAMSNNYQGCFFHKSGNGNGNNKLTKLMEVYQNELDNI